MRRSKKEAFGWPAQQDLPKRGLIVMHIYKFALLIVRALKYKYKYLRKLGLYLVCNWILYRLPGGGTLLVLSE